MQNVEKQGLNKVFMNTGLDERKDRTDDMNVHWAE